MSLRWYVLVFVAALLVKGTVLVALRDHPLLQPAGDMDGAVYLQYARVGPPPVPFFISPLYLYFLKSMRASIPAALAVQVVLGSLAVVLLFDTARRWFGLRGAAVTVALASLAGVLTFNETVILQSSLDNILVALSMWCLTLALQTNRWGWFATSGMVTALFALNRPNILLWIAALAVVLCVQRRFRAMFAFCAGCAVVFSPVLARNALVGHEWVLVSSHGGLNFFIGNNETADGTYHDVRGVRPTIEGQAVDARKLAEQSVGHPLRAREVSRWFYSRAFAWIREHPVNALALFVRKLAMTIHQTDVALNFSYDFFAHDVRSPLRWLIVGPWLLVPLGVAGAMTRWRDREFLPWVAFLPVYAISVAIFFVSSRYRLPLLDILAVCAAGVVNIRRPGPVVAGIVAAVVALWPLGVDSGRSEERTNMVVRLIELHRADEARQLLARWERDRGDPARLHHSAALAFLRTNETASAIEQFEAVLRMPAAQPVLRDSARDELAGLHARASRRDDALRVLRSETRETMSAERATRLGRIAMQLEAAGDAAQFFEVAVLRQPSNPAAWLDLGVAHLAAGDRTQALQALTRARSLDERDASTWFFLALAEEQGGDRASARHDAEEAVRLRPDFLEAKRFLENLRPAR
jgi:tetratricopeptide (TPR) repeat protein